MKEENENRMKLLAKLEVTLLSSVPPPSSTKLPDFIFELKTLVFYLFMRKLSKLI